MIPKVSVVTISYNTVSTLQSTIDSVREQDYPNLEYIIVDGGSTDGTLAIIDKNKSVITTWVSAKDKGIYDAMNKGVKLATGDWIIFMNSGDRFYKSHSISAIFQNLPPDGCDLIYGDVAVDYGKFIKVKTAGQLTDLWKEMQFSHQSLFCRKVELATHPFNVNQKIAGDYEFIYSSYTRGIKFSYAQGVTSVVTAGGVSDAKRVEAIKARWEIVNKYSPSLKVNTYYVFAMLKEVLKNGLKEILPSKLTAWIQRSR